MYKKMNTCNSQTAFEYAFYAIAASYYKSAKCITPVHEKKMRLHYFEQGYAGQEKMDAQCIQYMRSLRKKLPKSIWKEDVFVKLLGQSNGERTEIIFWGETYVMRFLVNYHPNRPDFSYEVWKKDTSVENA